MKCPNCNSNILADSKFCNYCGSKITKTNVCPKCGSDNLPKDSKFCPDCGYKIMFEANEILINENKKTAEGINSNESKDFGKTKEFELQIKATNIARCYYNGYCYCASSLGYIAQSKEYLSSGNVIGLDDSIIIIANKEKILQAHFHVRKLYSPKSKRRELKAEEYELIKKLQLIGINKPEIQKIFINDPSRLNDKNWINWAKGK